MCEYNEKDVNMNNNEDKEEFITILMLLTKLFIITSQVVIGIMKMIELILK